MKTLIELAYYGCDGRALRSVIGTYWIPTSLIEIDTERYDDRHLVEESDEKVRDYILSFEGQNVSWGRTLATVEVVTDSIGQRILGWKAEAAELNRLIEGSNR